MLTLEQLKKTNTTYGGQARTWDYLSRSYAGGNQYREAGYLRKYLGEDQAPGNQYAQRLISTALDNHVQNVVSIFRSYISKMNQDEPWAQHKMFMALRNFWMIAI